MAIDTAEKRLSILDGDPTTTPGLPLLDSSFGVPEKLHLLWLYSGLLDATDDLTWPFDDLQPRDIGIYPCAAPIGGGVSLTGKEATRDSGAGYWRIVLGSIPVKTRANIRAWRALEARLQGRANTIAIPIYDGKRAPWPGLPGGAIDAEAGAAAAECATVIQIVPVNIDDIFAGMHFSTTGNHLHCIKSVDESSAVIECTIWPPLREELAAGEALEFRRPLCRARLADDLGMSLDLDGHKRGFPSVEFVEVI